MTVPIPGAVCAAVYIISFDHILVVLAISGNAIAELTIAVYLLRRSQKFSFVHKKEQKRVVLS
jgi:hypothetical protein